MSDLISGFWEYKKKTNSLLLVASAVIVFVALLYVKDGITAWQSTRHAAYMLDNSPVILPPQCPLCFTFLKKT